jgi:hypothetical protein
MRPHAQDLIAAAARVLAGKAHTEEDLHDALYQLAIDIVTPPPSREPLLPSRRMPVAGEVLPRHQRATWARSKTIYDVNGGRR